MWRIASSEFSGWVVHSEDCLTNLEAYQSTQRLFSWLSYSPRSDPCLIAGQLVPLVYLHGLGERHVNVNAREATRRPWLEWTLKRHLISERCVNNGLNLLSKQALVTIKETMFNRGGNLISTEVFILPGRHGVEMSILKFGGRKLFFGFPPSGFRW